METCDNEDFEECAFREFFEETRIDIKDKECKYFCLTRDKLKCTKYSRFRHFNKKWLEGFELEGVYNWKRGGIIVFDRCQAHAGVNFPQSGVTMKCGLSMMSTIKK